MCNFDTLSSAKAEKMDMSVMAKSEKDMSMMAKSDKDMSIAKSEKVKSDGEWLCSATIHHLHKN